MEWIIGIIAVFLIIGWIRGAGKKKSNVIQNSAIAGVAGYAIGKKLAKL
jgi:hypothetical protein